MRQKSHGEPMDRGTHQTETTVRGQAQISASTLPKAMQQNGITETQIPINNSIFSKFIDKTGENPVETIQQLGMGKQQH
jgi:hypothetical protein